MIRAFTAGLAVCLLSAGTATAQEASLTIIADGLTADSGQVVVSLFATEADFLKRPLATKTAPAGSDRTAQVTFPGLAPGSYALSAYHDENANGELDTGFLGIPSEPVGTSNNAKGSFGPPDFADARFELPGGPTTMTVTLSSPF